MGKRHTAWRYFAKALGEKASKDNRESDTVAVIRTAIFFTYLITNCFIIGGNIQHWNDLKYTKQSIMMDCIAMREKHSTDPLYQEICTK